MDTISPNEWIFFIPDEKDSTYILYAPVHKFAVKISEKGKEEIQKFLFENETEKIELHPFKKLVDENHLLTFPKSWTSDFIKTQKRAPKLTISLTNKCNLRCQYCYAESGKDFSSMPWEIVKNAIDFIVHKAIQQGNKRVLITFHGGGEVFMEYKLMKKCVEYANKIGLENNIDFGYTTVTNATLISKERALWMKDSGFKNLTVSLDGTQDINDHQRRDAKGNGSFQKIMKGISNLNDAKLDFAIRSTVTNYGVEKMADFVNFASNQIFPQKGWIHFEPLSICGRASNSILSIEPKKYFDNYILAKEQGTKLGISVYCSLDTFKNERKNYCGASYGTMICITPSGHLTSCSRVTKLADMGSDLFIYGNYNKSEQIFEFDKQKIEQIITHGSLPDYCRYCYARWNCQGNCPLMRYVNKNNDNESCNLIRKLLKYFLIRELDSI